MRTDQEKAFIKEAEKDLWFKEHHLEKLIETTKWPYDSTEKDFIEWWINHYGQAETYSEQHEYWIRCSFALDGFIAGHEIGYGRGEYNGHCGML